MSNRSLRLFPASLSSESVAATPLSAPSVSTSSTQPDAITESGPSKDRQARELDQITGMADPQLVSIPLSHIVPLLMEASNNNHTWLSDFAEDSVQIDADLYDVLMAYRSMRGKQAA